MSRPNAYEDLDEMIVSQDSIDQDDIKVGKQTSAKAKKSQKGKTPLQIQREEEQHRKNVRMVMTIVGIFAVVLALLIAVGVWMGSRVPKPDIDDVIKAERAETSGLFISETNIPELSNQGVKGLLKEAYYTKEGNLAVTLNLSNGTPKEMKIVKVGIRVFNDKDETIADQKLEAKDFQIESSLTAAPRCILRSTSNMSSKAMTR